MNDTARPAPSEVTQEIQTIEPNNPNTFTECVESLGAKSSIVLCDVRQEIVVDDPSIADKFITGIDDYVLRIMLACDSKSVFLIPEKTT